jgi:plastocyanin
MQKMIISITVLFLALAFLFSGCTQSTPQKMGSSAAQEPAAAENIVEISNFAFMPPEIIINKGDTVVWINQDSAPHTIKSDVGNEINSGTLSNGQKYSHTFGSSGIFGYHCSIHASMKGKVVVR